MHHYLVIDQGTHASRCMVFDGNLQVIASKQHHIPIYRHSSKKIEQTPEKILASIYYCLDALAQEHHLEHVTSAALVTQRSTIVAWHKQTGKAISPAISWQDTRAESYLEQFTSAEEVRNLTGLPLSAHYGASKIRWLLDNNELCQQALSENNLIIGPLASYLVKHLTSNSSALVDYVNASRTLLFDIEKRQWSEKLADQLNIPLNILPDTLPNSACFGKIRTFDIPLNLVTGDQNAALYANGIPATDSLHINIGTGAFVIRNTAGEYQPDTKLLSSIAHSDNERCFYMKEGTVNGAGAALNQIARSIGDSYLFEQLPDWLSLIRNPPIFINAVGGIGSPWWNSKIESFFPDYRDFPPELPDRAVAVVESIAFLLQNNIELLKVNSLNKILISGGLARLDGLCQRIASLSGLTVKRQAEAEATARGAAVLLSGNTLSLSIEKSFEPELDHALNERYQRFTSTLIQLCH